jgi:uncharacterized repeat protein (TIGR03803 family)
MKTPSLIVCALFACCATIAACSQITQPSRFQYIPNAYIVPEHRNSPLSYRALYSFAAAPDGNAPHAGVIGASGTFYGTTARGGEYSFGTIFSITMSGKEKVLHSFLSGTDGRYPAAGLIDVDGTLYGTTEFGGKYGVGTLFSITPGRTEKVLHSFGRGSDGSFPFAGLIDVKGTLYGTTSEGGAYTCASGATCGTVFASTTGGTEKVVHSFGKGTDGSFPFADLIEVKGTLYGTTSEGGAYGCMSGATCGTVFSITTGGKEKVLHSFGKGTDGSFPFAGMRDVKGTLYGTTDQGGAQTCSGVSCGTVFSISTGGMERVLHSFGNGTDGSNPIADLIDAGGTLYGTTYGGGAYGSGTVFSITTGGTEKVLHSFGSGKDGKNPGAGMNYKGGDLIGTTVNGGVYGNGAVFSRTP